jgi:hypothetical protein
VKDSFSAAQGPEVSSLEAPWICGRSSFQAIAEFVGDKDHAYDELPN